MCPFWMPSVARARRAARFCARPAAAITLARPAADATPRIFTLARAAGCCATAPPTRPTASGSDMVPTKAPPSVLAQRQSGAYSPPPGWHAAYACAPASTARQSWPQATATAEMAFMMPLLFVHARYGSARAKSNAWSMASTTTAPGAPPASSSSSAVNVAETRARRLVARFERMRSPISAPGPHTSRMNDETASAMVLTTLAPMASRTSTSKCTTTRLDVGVSRTRASTPRQPPPRRTMDGTTASHKSTMARSFATTSRAASRGLETLRISTWPIITGSSISETMPPPR
mmetsp:Transcript_31933/g.110394  ORF Transcript_31933/g.110394 Transcript_31933/m.110394 type:complete len:290 (+) Transcript_31933:111-980(+)